MKMTKTSNLLKKAGKVLVVAAAAISLFATGCSNAAEDGASGFGGGTTGGLGGPGQTGAGGATGQTVSGAINLFSSTAETFSKDAVVADSLPGVFVTYKGVEWCNFAGQGVPALAEGFPKVQAFNNVAFTVGGTDATDSNGNATKAITGAYFKANAINVGGTSENKVTVASSGTTVVKVLFDVTAGDTPLTLKSVSLKAGQSQTGNADLYVAGVKVNDVAGKDLSVSNKALNKTIAANATETIAIEVKLTGDWKTNGSKAMDFVIGDLAFGAETVKPAAPVTPATPDDVLPEASKGAINLFSSTAEDFSGNAEIADSLSGVSAAYKSVEWCNFAGKGVPALAEGYPTVKTFANKDFKTGGVATGESDSSGNPTYGIKGAYFSANKIDVGGTSAAKTTIATSGTTVVKVLVDVTAGSTPLTLKSVSLKAGQTQTSNAELYVAGVKVAEGKDLTAKNVALNKSISSNTTESIAIEVKLTKDWASNGEKVFDFVIGDLAFDAEAAAATYTCSVCGKEWSTQEKADGCGNTENCPGYVAPVAGGSSSSLGGTPTDNKTDNKPEVSVTGATENVQILDCNGALESAWVKFAPVTGATSYEVYANDVKLDKELIRGYSTTAGGTTVEYYRADAVGLKAGSYTMKVVAVKDSGNIDATTGALEVVAQDRSGFAFCGSQTPGAYNADGTLKAGAGVIYVTKDTAKTVKYSVITASKGTMEEMTGLQAILAKFEKDCDHRPLSIRIIGTINASDMDSLGSSEEGLQIKGKDNSVMPITIEGIGDDGCLNNFGLLIRNSAYIEIKNLGVLNCMDDCVSIDTKNSYLWVHNCDLYYGKAGSGDHAKGDGSLDSKDATMCTYSYNHFWDSGKCNLLENGAAPYSYNSGSNYLTYHHNWYDHSDSRHPRVRYDNVHVYNNYYDGNSKYGVGSTNGSSVFVENNYFRNAKFPMMISLQGNDVYAGTSTYNPKNYGTFSSEDGGMIKSFNNFITGTTSSYVPYGAKTSYIKGSMTDTPFDSTVHYDAFEVTNRTDTVPETLKSFQGGHHYSNFDTKVNLNANVESPEVAKDNVTKWAGRVNGGDLKWTFDNSKEDTNDAVIADFKNAILGYKSKLVSTNVDGSSGSAGNTGDTGNTGDNGGTTGGTTTPDPVAVTGVTLNKTTASITVGGTETLTVTVAPTNATTKTVTWASSNTNVATVSTSGKVTAKAEGTATITVTTTEGSFTATCVVTVKAAPSAGDLDVTYPTVALAAGTYPANSFGSMITNGMFIKNGNVTTSSTQINVFPDGCLSFRLDAKSNIKATIGNKGAKIISKAGTEVYAMTGTGTMDATLDAGEYYITSIHATGDARIKTSITVTVVE